MLINWKPIIKKLGMGVGGGVLILAFHNSDLQETTKFTLDKPTFNSRTEFVQTNRLKSEMINCEGWFSNKFGNLSFYESRSIKLYLNRNHRHILTLKQGLSNRIQITVDSKEEPDPAIIIESVENNESFCWDYHHDLKKEIFPIRKKNLSAGTYLMWIGNKNNREGEYEIKITSN